MPTVCPWPIASARASARRRPRRRSTSSATQLATSVTTKEASGRATTCGHCWTRSSLSLGPISLWSSSTSVPKCLRTPPLAPSYPTPSTSTPPYLILKLRAQPSSINRLSLARARPQVAFLGSAVRPELPHGAYAGGVSGLCDLARLAVGIRCPPVWAGRARVLMGMWHGEPGLHLGPHGHWKPHGPAHLCRIQSPVRVKRPRTHTGLCYGGSPADQLPNLRGCGFAPRLRCTLSWASPYLRTRTG
jgi:hypothetical protein